MLLSYCKQVLVIVINLAGLCGVFFFLFTATEKDRISITSEKQITEFNQHNDKEVFFYV